MHLSDNRLEGLRWLDCARSLCLLSNPTKEELYTLQVEISYLTFYTIEYGSIIHQFIHMATQDGNLLPLYTIYSKITCVSTEEAILQLRACLPNDKIDIASCKYKAFTLQEISAFFNATGIRCMSQMDEWTDALVAMFLSV